MYSGPFDEVFRAEGVRIVRTPIRAPNANAHVERLISTLRRECLDWTLVRGRRHVDRTLRAYADHYNHERPHRGLALAVPDRPTVRGVPVRPRDVRGRAVLGGLIHEYSAPAA